jgi:hypothetical protein
MIGDDVIPILRPWPDNGAGAGLEDPSASAPHNGVYNGVNGFGEPPDSQELIDLVDAITDIVDVAAQRLLRNRDAHPENIGNALRFAVEELQRLRAKL